jgi:hypothetical protein
MSVLPCIRSLTLLLGPLLPCYRPLQTWHGEERGACGVSNNFCHISDGFALYGDEPNGHLAMVRLVRIVSGVVEGTFSSRNEEM